MADKSKTKETSDISNLPTELLHEVISHLDNASLVQLGLTCKRLHYISLHTYFEKNDIQNPSNGWLVAYQTPPETLPALRAALWVKEIRQLHFYFNPGIDELLAEVVDMYWLVKRLSKIELVKLHFSVVDTWVWRCRPSCQMLDSRRWFEVFTRLLEIIIERGCRDLQITGAGTLETMYKPSEVIAPKPLPQPAGSTSSATRNSTQANETPMASGSAGKLRSPNSTLVSNGQDLQGSISHPTSTIKKKKKKGWLWKLCSPTTLTHLISRKPRAKIGSLNVTGLPNHYATGLANVVEKKKSDIPWIQPRRARLTDVSILSEMLFQPTFFDWTVKTLTSNSFSITKLSLKCSNLTTETWSALLSSVTLPRLQNFEIATDLVVNTNGAAFADLRDFFVRHPSIDTLHLQGVERLPTPPTITGPILPNLVCMMTPPGWISSLLDMGNSYGSLSKLNSIGISTEYYHFDGPTFNYDLVDAALLRVAKFSGRRVTLTLRFMYEYGVSDWFSDHAAFGKENSVLNRLDCVSTLVISTAFFVDITKIPNSDLLTWFSLFPCVEYLKFVETVEEQRVLLEKPEFLKSVAEKCPQIKSIQIRQVIDLGKYRSG